MSTTSTMSKMFAPLPPSYLPEIRRQSMARLFGFCIRETRESAGLSIEEAARLSGMAASEWMSIEDGGHVPQELNTLRAMAESLQVNFEVIASMVLVCRAAWEL
jgi:DNA-binding XRE family transcriptional regulator